MYKDSVKEAEGTTYEGDVMETEDKNDTEAKQSVTGMDERHTVDEKL